MDTPLPDTGPPRPGGDRDLRLARRLDAGGAADGLEGGADPLHDVLRAVRPSAAAVDTDTTDRLWAGIDAEIGRARPEHARRDRPPLRLVRRPAVRWAVAATALLTVGVSMWLAQRGPDLVAAAGADTVTWEAPDGSTVVLRPNSRLDRLDDDARAYRLDGEAFFAVAPDPDRPFTVEAGGAAVRVLGTRFDVSTWGDRTAVFVEEGRVAVRAGSPRGRGGGAEIVLEAGEAATASTSGVEVLPGASAETFLDWRRGEAAFEREPVGRVVDEIAQHFGLVIVLGPEVARESVSGVIALDSAAQALDDLGRILGGRFEPDGSGYRFVRP